MEMWEILYILFCIKMDFYVRLLLSVILKKKKSEVVEALHSELVLLKPPRLACWQVLRVFGLPPPCFPQGEDPSDQEDHSDE